MARSKEQNYLNEAIYDKGSGSLDDIEQEKPVKYKKKPLGYEESILDGLFKKKKVVKNQPKPKREKKETSLGKTTKNPLNLFKKKKKELSFFNNL